MAQQYERERISLYKEKIQSIWNFFVNFAVCLDPRMLGKLEINLSEK